MDKILETIKQIAPKSKVTEVLPGGVYIILLELNHVSFAGRDMLDKFLRQHGIDFLLLPVGSVEKAMSILKVAENKHANQS